MDSIVLDFHNYTAFYSAERKQIPYEAKYVVLKDKTPEELIETARKHEDLFIITFLTGTVDECLDYSVLDTLPLRERLHILNPIYIGNFSEQIQKKLIRRYLKRFRNEYSEHERENTLKVLAEYFMSQINSM